MLDDDDDAPLWKRLARGFAKLLLAVVCVLVLVWIGIALESAPRWLTLCISIAVLLIALGILRTVHKRVDTTGTNLQDRDNEAS